MRIWICLGFDYIRISTLVPVHQNFLAPTSISTTYKKEMNVYRKILNIFQVFLSREIRQNTVSKYCFCVTRVGEWKCWNSFIGGINENLPKYFVRNYAFIHWKCNCWNYSEIQVAFMKLFSQWRSFQKYLMWSTGATSVLSEHFQNFHVPRKLNK